MYKINEWVTMPQQKDSNEEIVIKAKLQMIDSLLESIGKSEDRIIMQEIISNYSDIFEIQKGIIDKLSAKVQEMSTASAGQQCVVPVYSQPVEEIQNDMQLQEAFISYLTYGISKPLSSYTINDYLSRIRKLWKSFYEAYKVGELPKEIQIDEECVLTDSPLMNARNHLDELNCYVGMMSANSDEKRNWANMQAALNKFIEFVA